MFWIFKKSKPLKRELAEPLLTQYKEGRTDWLGYKITIDNYLTFLRIKGENGEPYRGSIITIEGAKKLKELKSFYPELYSEYCYMLGLIHDIGGNTTFEIKAIMLNMKERMESALASKKGFFDFRYKQNVLR